MNVPRWVSCAALFLAMTTPVTAATPSAGVYSGCRNTTDGTLRVIDYPAVTCKKSEALIQWVDLAAFNEVVARITALEGSLATETTNRQEADAALRSAIGACESLAPLASYLTIEPGELNGVRGPHVLFTGVNVHVRSALPNFTPDGRGNLIVGWNEPVPSWGNPLPDDRHGTNNLVVGPWHKFSSQYGFVAGSENSITGLAASVSGGHGNTASGQDASVSGGQANSASGPASSVSGGAINTASGFYTSVSGGSQNVASGQFTSVAGGGFNGASGDATAVSGGFQNAASGTFATVSGGQNLTAPDYAAHVP